MLGGGACLAAQLGCAQHWGPLLLGPCAAQPCGMLLLCKDDRTLADCVAGERACWEEGPVWQPSWAVRSAEVPGCLAPVQHSLVACCCCAYFATCWRNAMLEKGHAGRRGLFGSPAGLCAALRSPAAWPLCSTALWHAAVVLTLQAAGRMR